MFCIVVSHYLEYSLGGARIGELGRYLGGCGVIVFFLLSALLYGHKWIRNGRVHFDAGRYMKGRVIKLGSSLWPFLILILPLFFIYDIQFLWRDVVLNFAFLGYLGRLPGNPHLWFLTVIMICYLEFAFLSRVRIDQTVGVFLIALCLGAYVIVQNYGLPGHIFLTMAMCGWLFLNADKFISYVKRISAFWLWGMFLIINILSIYLFVNGLFDNYRLLSFPLYRICGITWLLLMLKVLPRAAGNAVVTVSDMSFEVYLVHQMFCSSPFFTVMMISGNRIVQFVCLIVISLVFAQVLHSLGIKNKAVLTKLLK